MFLFRSGYLVFFYNFYNYVLNLLSSDPSIRIIDKDSLDSVHPEYRTGVPQSKHVHLLLKRGLLNLEKNLPGIKADLEAAGSIEIDWMKDIDMYNYGM